MAEKAGWLHKAHFTGSEAETQGCELKPHKPAIKQGHDPDKLSATMQLTAPASKTPSPCMLPLHLSPAAAAEPN